MSEQTPKSTPILSLKKSNPQKIQSKKTDEKISPSEVDDHLIRWLRNEPLRFSEWAKVPRMDVEFQLVRSSGGGPSIILAVRNNTATVITAEKAGEILRSFLLNLPSQFAPFYINGIRATNILKQFRETPHHLSELPKSVGFKSDPALLLHRLDFDPVDTAIFELEEKAPCFSTMLTRMSNYESLMARIGSLFDPTADRKQAVWVYGPRDCGKSQIAYLLTLLCPNFAILGSEDHTSPYFKAMLFGNRVGIINEASARFIRSDVFKATTGDGMHAINQKYQPVFNALLDIIYFCFSNNEPEIPYDDSLMVRVIACKMSSVPPKERMSEHEFQARLRDELPYIVGAALSCYGHLKPGQRIPCSDEDLQDSINNFEEEYLEILENHVVAEKNHKITAREMTRFFEFCGFRSPVDKGRIKRILQKRYPVTKRMLRIKNSENQAIRAKVWEGVRLTGIPEYLRENVTFCSEDDELETTKI